MGSSWYRMGWSGFIFGGVGLEARGLEDGNRGGEEPLLSSQENPRALCQLRKTVSPCQELWQPGLPLSPVLSPATPCCVDPDKQLALSGKKQNLSPAPKGSSSRILELALENGHLTQRPRRTEVCSRPHSRAGGGGIPRADITHLAQVPATFLLSQGCQQLEGQASVRNTFSLEGFKLEEAPDERLEA